VLSVFVALTKFKFKCKSAFGRDLYPYSLLQASLLLLRLSLQHKSFFDR
jgi:hypothetical protein